MSSFTLPELKRLSEAAMPGPFVHEPCASFCSETAEWMGDTVTAQGEPICYDRDVSLLAYLGTHRDRIVALLEAADALADAAERTGDEPTSLVKLNQLAMRLDMYRAAKGGAK